MIKHLHHIIPRHAGGTDDPSNMVELTIAEHAEAHRLLFEQYGRIQDKVAYMGLLKMIDNDQAIHESTKIGGRNAIQAQIKKFGDNVWSGVKTSTNFALDKDLQKKAVDAARSESANNLRIKSLAEIEHQKGSKNSQFGTKWITQLETYFQKKIKKDDQFLMDG